MCFTGYAYETLDRLYTFNQKIGIDGKKWLYLERGKTDEPESVLILPIIARLIKKYNDHPVRIVSQKLIPVYSNQYFNHLLKEICRELDIDIKLTTHYGRHIFATMIALDNDADLKAVAQMLGQSSIRSAEIYTKSSQINISRTMAKIEKTLFTPDGQLKWQSLVTDQLQTNEAVADSSPDITKTEFERILDMIKDLLSTPVGQAKWQNLKNGIFVGQSSNEKEDNPIHENQKEKSKLKVVHIQHS